jgi:hypothetical protein
MKRAVDRTIQVLVWGVALVVTWSVVAKTAWAAGRSVVDAGPGYTSALEPLAYIAGVLLVAVPATLLVQHTHTALQRHRGAAPVRTVIQHVTSAPMPATDVAAIPTGRTVADLPANPPVVSTAPR